MNLTDIIKRLNCHYQVWENNGRKENSDAKNDFIKDALDFFPKIRDKLLEKCKGPCGEYLIYGCVCEYFCKRCWLSGIQTTYIHRPCDYIVEYDKYPNPLTKEDYTTAEALFGKEAADEMLRDFGGTFDED